MPDDTMRDHAVALTTFFRVFKLVVNGKEPAVTGWTESASNDPDIVRRMWTCPVSGESLDNNIGILTGDRFVVFDVDVKNGRKGLESLESLKDMGLNTDTITAETPSGGLHIYYALPPGLSIAGGTNMFGDGIDIRGWHNYVVAPPSVLDGKPYRWRISPRILGAKH